ncbi:MAG TPA: porin [Hyphomicrobiaceae bacterium]|nr:porin [Hyphomicrobiaceae bacterium]
MTMSSAPAVGRSVAVLAAAFICSGAAQAVAADLGGSCCADLEQRIAELEATAARKGTRKVSLTISGYAAHQITFWDDGKEENAYLWGMGPTQATHFKLNGQATISPGWTAGYLMRIQDLSSNPFGSNQTTPNSDQGLNVQMSYWYLQNTDLGKVSVGKMAHAGKSAAMFTDLSGTQIAASYVLFDGAGFFVRNAGALTGVTWGNLGFCYSQARPWGGDCNGIVMEGVRYDSPTLAGFTVSASWGEDDFWDLAARYGGEIAGFKLAGGIAYSRNTSERTQLPLAPFTGFAVKSSDYFQIGGYAQHLASGLFVHAAYGREDNSDTLLATGRVPEDGRHWYVKGGLRKKWLPLGHTVLWGEYAAYLDQLGPAALATGATGSEFDRWGGGLAQEIDAAAMTLWAKYRRYEAEVAGGTLTDVDDADFLGIGALINF